MDKSQPITLIGGCVRVCVFECKVPGGAVSYFSTKQQSHRCHMTIGKLMREREGKELEDKPCIQVQITDFHFLILQCLEENEIHEIQCDCLIPQYFGEGWNVRAVSLYYTASSSGPPRLRVSVWTTQWDFLYPYSYNTENIWMRYNAKWRKLDQDNALSFKQQSGSHTKH